MYLIKILSEQATHDYEHPPQFNYLEQTQFFYLAEQLQKLVSTLYTPTNKVCFLLCYAYFKACGRFFAPNKFRAEDIEFVCRRFGFFSFAFDIASYDRATFLRHKTIILESFACIAFDPSNHKEMLTSYIQPLLRSKLRPRLIFYFMLEKLQEKNIELPTYHSLQKIIAQALKNYELDLSKQIEQHLTAAQKQSLDKLLDKPISLADSKSPYCLTWLKEFNPKDKPKTIKENVEKLKYLQTTFDQINPLLNQLNLNDEAIRHYGEMVIRYQVAQINRRKAINKYLHLMSFVAYQLHRFSDWLTDILLAQTQRALNMAKRIHEQKQLEKHRFNRPAIKRVFNDYQSILEKQQQAQSIVWSAENQLSSINKVELLKKLFPLENQEFQQEYIQQIEQYCQHSETEEYYDILQERSLVLQQRATPIVKELQFSMESSSEKLHTLIEAFKHNTAQLNLGMLEEVFTEEENQMIVDEQGKLKMSLAKVLLFRCISDHIKAGSLNLRYSYRFRAYDQYLIDSQKWKTHHQNLFSKAQLNTELEIQEQFIVLKEQVKNAYQKTNESILSGENKFMRFYKKGRFSITTPKVENENAGELNGLFPDEKITPVSKVLACIEKFTDYLECFEHRQTIRLKQKPDKAVFLAGIMAYGCNLGLPTMTKVANSVSESALVNTVNWYFDLENIDKANDKIIQFMSNLPLPQIYKAHKDQLHTSSDGQKLMVKGNSVFAAYSYKYRGHKAITAYSYLDERFLNFASFIFNSNERESTYMVDGLLHDKIVRSSIHSTDTHGYTEAVFALMNLLGFEFAPRIARLSKQRIYAFTKKADIKELGYKILPDGYIDTQLIHDNWNSILRLVCSIKLKECTASQIFKRLNSYSRQHPVYQALKEYGKIIKTIFILKYIDDIELRKRITKQLNKVEHSNRFSDAIFFANNNVMIFVHRTDQLIAESCKRLIKNAIICWNYLYLTQLIQKTKTIERKQQILKAIKAGSAMTWQHIYFHGQYDFSEETLNDSFEFENLSNFQIDLEAILSSTTQNEEK